MQNDLDVIKFKILAKNKELAELYEKLVVNQLLTEEEFWKDRDEIKNYLKVTKVLE